ncbi:MAG: B12-binding domain-containing radical SAM protein [Elusimicrobia bacterium]|nr:B12-binding domain-containing radical SAM protein [Elusimicrobiota bacterium]
MHILLINPPDELGYALGVGMEFIQRYEPLGLLYIAAVARETGHHVTVIDAYARNMGPDELKKEILSIKPDIVGITTFTCSGAVVFELGQWLKKTLPGSMVVLGNVHASAYAKQYLENRCCDIVVHGEGEYTFLKIIEYFDKKCRIEDIPSVSFIGSGGNAVQTSSEGFIEDLSGLPVPARDLLDQGLYRPSPISNQMFVPGKNSQVKTMITSRGCTNRCTFCAVHRNRKIRFNDAVSAVNEMEILEKKYGASYIYIMDPAFLSDRNRIRDICSEIRKRNLKIRWGCDAHVSQITPELVKEIDGAGCYELSLGIESGNQESLDRINKGCTISGIENAVAAIKDNSDIFIEGLFILGLPGETYSDSLNTIRFSRKLRLDMAQFSILVPYPGSPLFYELREKGELDTGIRPDGSVDTSVWKRYSSYICFTDTAPIWVTDTLSPAELRRLQKKAIRSFYARPSQALKHLKRLRFNNLLKVIRILMKGFF